MLNIYSSEKQLRFTEDRIHHWDNIAKLMDNWTGWGKAYHQRLEKIYRDLIPPGLKVLELGCGTGDLLASLQPSLGYGVDYSFEMLLRAKKKHPGLIFTHADAHDVIYKGSFDVIILSDLLNDVWDVQDIFENIRNYCNSCTRVIINTYSRLWEIPLFIGEKLNIAKPVLNQNWLTVFDIRNLFKITGYQVIRNWSEILLPVNIPILSDFANQFLVKLPFIKHFALTNFLIARGLFTSSLTQLDVSVSVIVPTRNEAGNIQDVVNQVPDMGKWTEIIFVEGHSIDDTVSVIERCIADDKRRRCRFYRQPGEGKANAVQYGFEKANGDIVMILDADLTVPPQYLTRFYNALVSGRGEMINGVRLVYPREKDSMRLLNLVANKFFGMAFTWVLGQPVKDTLCGTKALWKKDYELISKTKIWSQESDPFGDFDLLLGAALLNLEIVDMPVRYIDRKYGHTNIRRWKHGWILFRLLIRAAGSLKFN